MGAIRMLTMMGGDGGFIKSLSPIFYIKDLTQVVGGYFIDSSGNNKQIQAATTTVPNDSIIMPANDVAIISALTAAGCYSQFYTDNSTPKKVLLSNISPCYRDYSYYNYFDKKNFTLFSSAKTTSRVEILKLNNISICAFNSVQTGTATQVSCIYQCYTNKLAYVDYGNWGNQSIQQVNATEIDHGISSTGYLANTTYRIQLFTKLDNLGFKKIYISNVASIKNFNSDDVKSWVLTYFRLFNSGGDHIINLSHFYNMPLTYFVISTLSNTNAIGLIENLPASLNEALAITGVGSGVVYNNGNLPSWSSLTFTIQTGLTTAMVDSFLINYASVAGAGIKTINLAGNNQPRTASDPNVIAAITTLQGLGKTVETN